MRIQRELLQELIEHALEDAPNECCGMVASRDGEAVAVHRVRNSAASPLRYEMDPTEQHRVWSAIEDAGLDLGAIYHSHTRSEPLPSQTDINLAKLPGSDLPAWPGTLYVIVGVKDRGNPEVRAWEIVGNDVAEAPLEVV